MNSFANVATFGRISGDAEEYSSPNLKTLRNEHGVLTVIAEQLSALIAQRAPPPARELYQLRMQFASALVHHLNSEDWILYPALLLSGNKHAALTARAFSSSMGGLANEFKTYSDRWTAQAITSHWKGYQSETFEILRILTLRMAREERDLYPLWNVATQAAR